MQAAAPTPTPPPPLSGRTLAVATVSLSLATFMNVLDTTIANVSIPAISGDVGVSPSQGTWVITSFAVANAISMPLTGWLTQRFGQVRLFVGSVLLFVLASLLCGLSSSLEMLIAFRVLQGLVAGPMIPLSQALLLQSFPRARAGAALAAWSMTTLIAPVLGPILGGWISDNMSWPWIFYINVPAGLLAGLVTWRIFRHRESPIRKLPIDVVGLGLLVLWVGALQVMLEKGKELDWFASGQIVALGVTAVVGFCFFLIWELGEKHPIVDLSLFKRRNFSTGVVAIALGYGMFFGSVVLMPLWLQQYLGYTATWAGLVTAPIGIFAMILSPVVGKTLHKTDPRLYASAAFILFAVVNFMRSEFTLGVGPWQLVLPQLIQGAAVAAFFIPLTSLTLSGLSPDRIPAASGLSNFLRMVAAAVGASVSTTTWENRASMHHAQLAEHVNAYEPAARSYLDSLMSLGMSRDAALAQIERQLNAQAYMLSANEYFWLSGLLLLGLAALIWLAKPQRQPAGGGGAAAMDAGH
ncbi:DHA2 family efflux MFS transporter permease subunit [Azoarcus sp. TTM-91]|uniref:DHA2 family efflux MFS transporter permease subunit n=1 Tax=Azoarcus sp. TTM-91 TaxID=2691581 RepID=UPI00145DC6B6|nr:DHA2 family efflux MFS transporter permease subunit [Azoarcus sp. TTM-91]NMG33252.1 DHA2 family efflux MFS transporter permease subunit [Azoarcus sp. TTM-91]